jgi:nucleotide-binding universal stress UspA family protein
MLIKKLKILIAVEPFSENIRHLQSLTHFAKLLWPDSNASFQITSVVSTTELQIPDLHKAKKIEDLKHFISKNLKIESDFCGTSRVDSIEVIAQESSSASKKAQTLLDHAEANHADYILLHTHSKSSLRSMIGSFANAALQLTKIPIVVISPDQIPPERIQKLLYPTDFSARSHWAFSVAINICRELGADMLLYHRSSTFIDQLLEIGVRTATGQAILPWQIVPSNKDEKNEKATQWQNEALEKNVRVRIEFTKDGSTLGNSILDAAEKNNIDFIILPTKTAALDVPSFGSTVSQVVRHSDCPVLVIPVSQLPNES